MNSLRQTNEECKETNKYIFNIHQDQYCCLPFCQFQYGMNMRTVPTGQAVSENRSTCITSITSQIISTTAHVCKGPCNVLQFLGMNFKEQFAQLEKLPLLWQKKNIKHNRSGRRRMRHVRTIYAER